MKIQMQDTNRKKLIDELLKSINLTIDDYALLDIALTHSSFTFENKDETLKNNERMEFLGDAVLKLIASRYLYERFPEYTEGELTKIRAIIISDKVLAHLAVKINLANYLKLGYHEEKLGGRKRASTLACAFEAILGAFYIDGKLDGLYDFLVELLEDEVTTIDESVSKNNFKAMLQEHVQADGIEIPEYIVAEEQGPAHNRIFIIEVYIKGQKLGFGEGKSKKEAHQNAAKMALIGLGLIEGEVNS